jgi:hypothetical protein
MAEEEPWGWARTNSYMITHPALMLVQYNGNPKQRNSFSTLLMVCLHTVVTKEDVSFARTVAFKTDDDVAQLSNVFGRSSGLHGVGAETKVPSTISR